MNCENYNQYFFDDKDGLVRLIFHQIIKHGDEMN